MQAIVCLQIGKQDMPFLCRRGHVSLGSVYIVLGNRSLVFHLICFWCDCWKTAKKRCTILVIQVLSWSNLVGNVLEYWILNQYDRDLFECKLIIVEAVIIVDCFPLSFPLLLAVQTVSRRYECCLLALLFKETWKLCWLWHRHCFTARSFRNGQVIAEHLIIRNFTLLFKY